MFIVLDQWSDRPVNRDATREWSPWATVKVFALTSL